MRLKTSVRTGQDAPNEFGGISIIVAILISSGFLVGLFIMVSDVATLYTERRVVQNAADAAALALANECAINGLGAIDGNNSDYPQPICSSTTYAKLFATYYANINSPDQSSKITEICGSVLSACSEQPASRIKCQVVPSQYSNFVRVVAQSLGQNGKSLEPIFSNIFSESSKEIEVFGCAQAAWGNTGSSSIVFPFSLSICDYRKTGPVVAIDFASNNPTLDNGCSVTDLSNITRTYTSPLSGFALTAGFGCPGSSVPQIISVGDALRVEPSLTSIESICGGSSQFYSSINNLVGKKIIVPAVGNVECNSQSNNCQGSFEIKVAGFLSFNFIGGVFKNRGAVGNSPVGGWPKQCNSSRNCIYGNFDEGLYVGGSINTNPNVPNTGAQTVMLLP